jgi:hypothetical protein
MKALEPGAYGQSRIERPQSAARSPCLANSVRVFAVIGRAVVRFAPQSCGFQVHGVPNMPRHRPAETRNASVEHYAALEHGDLAPCLHLLSALNWSFKKMHWTILEQTVIFATFEAIAWRFLRPCGRRNLLRIYYY